MIRFSIVMPTRQRHETLGSALKTVLSQDFDDYEIIVSDNFSSHETKSVVDSFNSSKIKYFRTQSPLAMSENWELALSKATGEYIIFLGDDDGLVSGALKNLNEIIIQTNYKLIKWERVYYSWPNMQPEVFANKVHIKFKYDHRKSDGKTIIAQVIDGADVTNLPMLYNSVAHFSLINNHVSSTGRFFHSVIPDVYSGFILAHLSGKFLSLGIPMSINAGSAKSNGASFLFKKRDQQINNDFAQLNNLAAMSFDESVPPLSVRSVFIGTFEPYLKFIKTIESKEYKLDKLEAFILIIKQMIVYDEEEFNESSKAILTVAKKEGLDLSIIREKLSKVQISDINLIRGPKCGFSISELVLDGSQFGLENVFDVSIFAKKFYDYESCREIKFDEHEKPILKLPLGLRIRKAIKVLYKGTV